MNRPFSALFTLFLFISVAFGQGNVPAPKDILGFTPGDDRKLASWSQVLKYFEALDKASDRVQFKAIGKSTMDRPFVYATISAPENLRRLEFYKQINAKLADPRLIKSNDLAAKRLIKQGKTIVLVTYGIHSTEVGSTLSSMLMAHKLASSNDPEILKILKDTIILMVPSLNPDGVDIVKNWYDKTLGTKFEGTEPPELYHKYVGHDNNRDWYAFTQIETQLTVKHLHNEWHPQIVNDVHQQGEFGARFFIPPYKQPVEPNVPKQIVEGYTELGGYVADQMRKQGLQGITTNTTYDAWTPARAYSHYHGGVRILTETASCDLATPKKIEFDKLRGNINGIGYDAKKESADFGPVWKGGEWKLRDITNYMVTSTSLLLKHAAENRERWLGKFYEIGKEAVRPRKKGELNHVIIDRSKSEYTFIANRILEFAGVEIDMVGEFSLEGNKYENGTFVIKMNQPYGAFAKALLEKQTYPDLKDEKGNPIPPYDVTAHTLSLLMPIETKFSMTAIRFPRYKNERLYADAAAIPNSPVIKYLLYKSHVPSMDEGWTRYVFEEYEWVNRSRYEKFKFKNTLDREIRSGNFKDVTTIIFPDQSSALMLDGYKEGTMPSEYTGGIGKEGVENLKKFVEAGGTLVFLNRASNFAIEQFGLPIKDVTSGVNRKEFYIPGSILRTNLDTSHPIAKDMPTESIAWFENSPVFEILPPKGGTQNITVIAKYPDNPKDILLSGWALGTERIAGKAALVEVKMGKGKIILFGFRPQYRGQSLATFPLLFNSITK